MMQEDDERPGIRELHGTVIIEQEVDADGRPGAWRSMVMTVPLFTAPGLITSISMRIDLPAGTGPVEGDGLPAGGTWTELMARMGIRAQGEHDGEED